MTGYVSGKVAIVTGAGRGIGRAIAMLMAKEGASVVVVDLGAALDGSGGDQGPAHETVKEIEAAGGEAIASTLSITEPQNAEAIVKSAIDKFGKVDILVNNAGILRDRIFHRMSWSDWHDVINVHLNGSYNMARAVAGHFREQDLPFERVNLNRGLPYADGSFDAVSAIEGSRANIPGSGEDEQNYFVEKSSAYYVLAGALLAAHRPAEALAWV